RSLRVFCAAASGELRDLLAGRPPGWHEGALDGLIVFNQGLADTLPDGEALGSAGESALPSGGAPEGRLESLPILSHRANAHAGPLVRLSHHLDSALAGRRPARGAGPLGALRPAHARRGAAAVGGRPAAGGRRGGRDNGGVPALPRRGPRRAVPPAGGPRRPLGRALDPD